MRTLDFTLRGPWIALDDLLKVTGLVDSGGRAKHLITSGEVKVDNLVETRRSKKIRAGQVVKTGAVEITILPSSFLSDVPPG